MDGGGIMRTCKNKYQHMKKKYCGSHAIGDDPELKLCNVCYAYRKGQEDERARCIKIIEDFHLRVTKK